MMVHNIVMVTKMVRPVCQDQRPEYKSAIPTAVSKARLKAIASGHPATGNRNPKTRRRAIPGHTAINQSVIKGRSGDCQFRNAASETASVERTNTNGQPQRFQSQLFQFMG